MKLTAALFAAAAFAALPRAAAAQEQRLQFNVAGFVAQQIVQSHVDPASTRLTGMLVGLDGGLVSNRLAVRVHYGEGRITPREGATGEARDEVEGEALVGFRALPWLTLWGGPSARAYTLGDSDQRWMIWTARASARGALFPGRLQTFLELWGAFSGTVGDPAAKAGGRGANGGLEVRLGESGAFWGRMGYRIESMHAPGLRETVESLTLSVMYGLPQ